MLCKFPAFNQDNLCCCCLQCLSIEFLINLSRNQALIPLHMAFESPEWNNIGSYSILQEKSAVRIERGGSWMNFTNLLTSELVFFTVLAFLCSWTKTSTSWLVSGVLVFKPSFSSEILTSKFNAAEWKMWLWLGSKGSNNCWKKLAGILTHDRKVVCDTIELHWWTERFGGKRRAIHNGFPAFWLAVFSMAWYKWEHEIILHNLTKF